MQFETGELGRVGVIDGDGRRAADAEICLLEAKVAWRVCGSCGK